MQIPFLVFKTSEENKFLGLYKKNFKKFDFEKKNFKKNFRKFFKIQFLQKKIQHIILFDCKFDFRMFSAFISYTYCQCRSKIMNFQKLSRRKLKIFSRQTMLLRRHHTKNLQNIGWFSKTLQLEKDASSHLRPCLVDLGKK